MKKVFFGFILGVAALVAFIYTGGGSYLKEAGKRTGDAGEVVEGYEKKMKKTTRNTRDSVEDTIEKARETVADTTDRVKELLP